MLLICIVIIIILGIIIVKRPRIIIWMGRYIRNKLLLLLLNLPVYFAQRLSCIRVIQNLWFNKIPANYQYL